MTVGTRSVLFGAHCFLVHPWFVALAWWKLFGFPCDLRIWLAFFVHDLGYIGCCDMDGEAGEKHPEFGARLMGALFGQAWHDFTLLHSRFYAQRIGKEPSRLCAADKLSIALTPSWLYLPMANASGEISEYMALSQNGKYALEDAPFLGSQSSFSQQAWFESVCSATQVWVASFLSQQHSTANV